jgi:cobalt/nickel transport system permease protein
VPLFALHLADGFVPMDWCTAGFVAAALLVAASLRRLREDDIPKIALMTAAFFVTSSIHVRMGPTSVHLIMIGLVGVVLGGSAPLAIFVGLLMQAMLLGHGGFTTLGISTVTLSIPALLFGLGFRRLLSRPAIRRNVALRYALSVCLGVASLMTAIGLQGAVLWFSVGDFTGLAIAWVAAHAALSVLEGILTGGIVDFLLRVKPELLGVPHDPVPSVAAPVAAPTAIDERIQVSHAHSVEVGSGNTSSSGTSH